MTAFLQKYWMACTLLPLVLRSGACAPVGARLQGSELFTVRPATNSAFVVRPEGNPGNTYVFRRSVELGISQDSQLVDRTGPFFPPIALPVSKSLHCRIASDGTLLVSRDRVAWITVGRLPLFQLPDAIASDPPPLAPLEYQRFIARSHHGTMDIFEFEIDEENAGKLIMRSVVRPTEATQ